MTNETTTTMQLTQLTQNRTVLKIHELGILPIREYFFLKERNRTRSPKPGGMWYRHHNYSYPFGV